MANTMRTVAIVQARMSSSRLPGKVLLPLAGRPVLAHVVGRISACVKVDQVVVATSTDPSDEPIIRWCRAENVSCHQGSLTDVLDRFLSAARHEGADAVVRITADCPAIDPTVVDAVIAGFWEGGYDYFGLGGGFPDGLDCEILSMDCLTRVAAQATRPSDREHVTPFVKRNPGQFKSGELRLFEGLAHHRWTLDQEEDLAFLTAVFDRLQRDDCLFSASEILKLLDAEPDLLSINAGIERNVGYRASVAAEEEHRV